MRILLAATTVCLLLFGTKFYLAANQPKVVQRIEFIEQAADGTFTIELLPLFDAGPDAFALEAAAGKSIVVELRGTPIYSHSEPAKNGQPITIEKVAGLKEGMNELFVMATPADGTEDAVRGMRVRVLRNGLVLAEDWLSSEPGSTVEGTVKLHLTGTGPVNHDQ